MRVGVRTVRSWLKVGAAPSWKRRFRRRSIFDLYVVYVLERLQSGIHDGKQFYEEIRTQGFTGSSGIVKRFLQTLRGKRGKPRSNQNRPAPNNPTWLFIRQDKDLTAEERIELFLLCQHSPTAKLAYPLVQVFLTMLRQSRGEEFEGWVQAAEVSHIPELERFAINLLRDRKAVGAGLAYAYSSGPVEAQVHKLKLVKRSMYGRAKLPLLRQRLLHVRQRTPDREGPEAIWGGVRPIDIQTRKNVL